MPQLFKPVVKNIDSISGNTVTTDGDHYFVIGNIVYFKIPAEYGMIELNAVKANVLNITADTFTIDVNTDIFTPFVVPASPIQPAQVVGIGSTNYNLASDTLGIDGASRLITT